MKSLSIPALLLALMVLLLFPACTLFEPQIAVIWTDIPEIAAYAEMYNAEGDEVKVNVIYREHPSRIPPDSSEYPDIIIGRHLNSVKTIPLFESLGELSRDEEEDTAEEEDEESEIDASQFYHDILTLGIHEGEQVLLPLSFDLQGMMIRKNDPGIESHILSLDEVKALSLAHNAESRTKYQMLGFSPAWEREAGLMIPRIIGADFREDSAGRLAWEDETLSASIGYSREWISEVNGGVTKDQEFIQKYLYDPGPKLLDTEPGRIRFFPTTLSDFAHLPSSERDPLDICWVHGDGRIPVLEDLLQIL